MPRIRTIKPEFFRHEKLQDLHSENPSLNVMLVYAGLWTQCDMNGVFVWQPRQMKLDILPFIDYDMCAVLDLLTAHGFIKKFSANGKEYGHIPTFLNNQHIPTKKEKSKEHRIKSVGKYKSKRLYNTNIGLWYEIINTVFKRDSYTCAYCGKIGGKLECDHITPISKGGTNELENLTTSCQKCNRQKRDKTVSEFLQWRIERGITE